MVVQLQITWGWQQAWRSLSRGTQSFLHSSAVRVRFALRGMSGPCSWGCSVRMAAAISAGILALAAAEHSCDQAAVYAAGVVAAKA